MGQISSFLRYPFYYTSVWWEGGRRKEDLETVKTIRGISKVRDRHTGELFCKRTYPGDSNYGKLCEWNWAMVDMFRTMCCFEQEQKEEQERQEKKRQEKQK